MLSGLRARAERTLDRSRTDGSGRCDGEDPALAEVDDEEPRAVPDQRLRVIDATEPGGPGLGIEFDEALLDDLPHQTGDTYAEVFTDHETGRLER